jgi:type IV pilus assembly protein PilW
MATIRSVRPHLTTGRFRRQRGFTLIEMLISITIGLGILAGLVGVLASNASNSRSNDRTSELMTNGRYALNSIKHELREAGFRGYTWAEPLAPAALGGIVNECLETVGQTAGSFLGNIRQGVWGSNNANPFAASCIPPANYAANTDVMVVRRLNPTPTPAASLVANSIYFHTTYDRGQMFRGATPPTFTGAAPLASFAFQTFVYYIRPWTVSAAENPQIPALVRVALAPGGGGNPTFASELVASGIERMEVQYGRLTTTPDTQYLNNLPGASFSLDPTLSTDWEEINAVRIWLLARNATAEPGYTNTTTYAMGDQAFTPNDNFRRQLFTTVVQLRN